MASELDESLFIPPTTFFMKRKKAQKVSQKDEDDIANTTHYICPLQM